jgi:hypothetical protein
MHSEKQWKQNEILNTAREVVSKLADFKNYALERPKKLRSGQFDIFLAHERLFCSKNDKRGMQQSDTVQGFF